MTGGRSTVSDWIVGIPPIWLTATGAKSGLERTVPLYAFPVGQGLGLLGTSFGRPATPGWVYNLESNPSASVMYKSASIEVSARRAAAEEESEIWNTAIGLYAGYQGYRERVTTRDIRVFVLEQGR